jgi:hypothetical protein
VRTTVLRARGVFSAGLSDGLCAVAAGAVALAVYLRTLAPGLVATIDTPMFQFIGRVLGVAHNPGYPLYVLLTHPFSFIPIGSLPYRINLFSALLGAVAVSLTFLLARRLGCRTTVSVIGALGLAFGQVYWSQSVIAEVYTLHAALIAGMLLALLAWGKNRRPAVFFGAVAIFAVGLGNHTTIVGFAPAAALYALLTDRRFVTRLRTLAISTAILAAGLLQYGFIILRSRQPGAYVESPATTIGELVDVMLARQFQDSVFAFGWREVVAERLPFVVERILLPELTLAGLAFAAAGLAWLLARRTPEGLLLAGGCAAVVGFAAVYHVVDTPVFLIPAILVLWLAAAVGLEQAARLTGHPRARQIALALVLVLLPVWQLVRNFPVNDRSRDTEAAEHLDAVFETLPSRAILVREDFLVDRMVMFKLLADAGARGREIELELPEPDRLSDALAEGVGVFAFIKSAGRLRESGMNVSFAPVPLLNGSLPEYLSRLVDGSIVAVAVPRAFARQFAASHGASFADIGEPGERASASGSGVAILGARGARRGARVQVAPDARLAVSAGRGIGQTGVISPATIDIRAHATEAVIRHGSRELVWTSGGVAVAAWAPDGTVAHTFVLQADDDFRVAVPGGPLSVYRVLGAWHRQDVPAGRWSDITGAVSTGSVMVRLPPRTAVVLYVSDDGALAPRMVERSSDAVSAELASHDGPEASAFQARLASDRVPEAAMDLQQKVYRVEISNAEAETVSVTLALGGLSTRAVGRATVAGPGDAVTLFRVDTGGLLRTPDRRSEVLGMARDDQAQLTGAGWSPVESDGVAPYRWITAPEARLVLPVASRDASRIRVRAMLDVADNERGQGVLSTIRLRLNGANLPPQPLRPGWHVYEWPLDPGMLPHGVSEASIILEEPTPPQEPATSSRRVAVGELRIVGRAGSPQ